MSKEKTEFGKFIDYFIHTSRTDDPLPFNVSTYRITLSELDWEVVDLAVKYLKTR